VLKRTISSSEECIYVFALFLSQLRNGISSLSRHSLRTWCVVSTALRLMVNLAFFVVPFVWRALFAGGQVEHGATVLALGAFVVS
jgi:hypothetical protein